ncbi:MAG: hypothetical protein ACI8QZ_003289 [Chlamydiales bacterium]|jgi:hypothetical protein
MIRHRLLILALCLSAACRSTEPELYDIYRGTLEELAGAKGMSTEARTNNAKRHKRVRKWLAEGRIVSAQDHLYAAGALSTSDEMTDLELARDLATRADELGESLGRVLVAETTDKILVQQGQEQRYGTQLYLDLPTKLWHMYPFDPMTTEGERTRMGLPSLAEMLRRVEERNQQSDVTNAVIDAIGDRPEQDQ